MNYRINKGDLLDRIGVWNRFLKKKVRLIACGGTAIDTDDCLSLLRAKRKEIDLKRLIKRFRETSSFDISEDKVNKNLEHFLILLGKEGLYDEKEGSP